MSKAKRAQYTLEFKLKNDMKVSDILVRAQGATADHLEYARFVQDAEMVCDETDIISDEKRRSACRACWFELEILNALALDNWESAGKPAGWAVRWNERYKRDAE